MVFFFFNDTATTEIYTLSLHDALPISGFVIAVFGDGALTGGMAYEALNQIAHRSEEHTSELQSRSDLVCRLLLEKKKTTMCERPSSSLTVGSPGASFPARVLAGRAQLC